eukprot:4412921-Pleurochrysis_carterae.AAC.1
MPPPYFQCLKRHSCIVLDLAQRISLNVKNTHTQCTIARSHLKAQPRRDNVFPWITFRCRCRSDEQIFILRVNQCLDSGFETDDFADYDTDSLVYGTI